ncbi:MAG: HAD hydrolase-like protein, partial [Chitinophagales bacterium]|nr:HAD hydrolase-like protein [Chitinophagales bacterium]
MPKPVAIRELLEEIYEETPENLELLTDTIHKDFCNLMIDFYKNHPSVKGKTNAVRTMLALKNAGIKVALDTGFSKRIAGTIIERLGWDVQQVIDFYVASDEVERGRPYPDLIYKAMELAQVDNPSEVAKIGDTQSDLQQGTSAGCKLVIGVTTGAQPRNILENAPHTHLVEDLYEVVDIIMKEQT